MSQRDLSWNLISAGQLVDGRGGTPVRDGAVLVQGSTIRQVGPYQDIRPPGEILVTRCDFPGKTILPGLIDMHTHLNLAGGRPSGGAERFSGETIAPSVLPHNLQRGLVYERVAETPTELLVLQSAYNARVELGSGVTTVGDCGARDRTTFLLREGIRMGMTKGPRLVLCGRVITITRGHFWMMGIEADGPDAARRAVRQLVHEGADFMKVMGTGGATIGTNPLRPSFTVEELRAIVEEAHKFGKPVAVHNRCTQGISNSLEAGADMLLHCDFRDADGAWRFDAQLAKRIAHAGVWVNPTLHTLRAVAGHFQALSKQRPLANQEQITLQDAEEWYRDRSQNVKRLLDEGVKLIAGSDLPTDYFLPDQFYREIDAMVETGLTPMEGIVSATRNAATAIGIADRIGTLEPGKEADVLVVDGDPTKEIQTLGRVEAVFLAGQRIE